MHLMSGRNCMRCPVANPERSWLTSECKHCKLTWVAVLLALELISDAEERAITLRAGVLPVKVPLGLNPVEQGELDGQQGACA